MTETVVQFGPNQGLLGILTAPDDHGVGDLACLLINAGVIHRIGPHRLNVKIARTLAKKGVTSLRLDLSGLGDSEVAGGDNDFWDQAVIDLQAAMNLLERTQGIKRFVVLGICSGAVNGYWLTKADRRVTALLMFDGFAFPTWKTALIRRWTRFRKLPLGVVIGGAFARARQLVGRALSGGDHSSLRSVARHPSKEEFAATMQEFVDRGVAVCLAYSHTIEQHNYAAQLYDTYPTQPFVKRIRYEYVPDIDHALTPLSAQRQFIATLEDWMAEVLSTR
jgi:pimeloyl-ACP methyl ester carboxylesterase